MELSAAIIIMIIGLILILTFYEIGIYNRIIDSKNKVESQFLQIDAELKAIVNAIPELEKTITKNIKHEEKLINKLLNSKNKIDSIDNINDKIDSVIEIKKIINKIFSLEEVYPELKSNKNFIKLKKEINTSFSKIEYASSFYNDKVLEYNNLIKKTSYIFISRLFKLTEIKYLK